MTEVHRLPDLDQVEHEASQWIARLHADDVSAEDQERFEAWRSSHPVHQRTYDRLSATWRDFIAAGPMVRAVSFGQSMNDAAKVRIPLRRRFATAMAAALILITAATWYITQRTSETFQTAIGEHAAVSLPDGSTLELNSNSLARVDYSDRKRVIHLERGEAFFKVMHDTSRPFWVMGGHSWVRAVGTAFNVYVRQKEVRVTVSDGTVRVGASDFVPRLAPSEERLVNESASVLTAGQQADMHGSTTAIRSLPSEEIARSISWRTGTVYFDNQALSEVADELGRYSTLRLIVNDDHLGRLPIGGTFQANPAGVEAFLRLLKDGFGLSIRRETGSVYIERPTAGRSK